MKHDVTNLKLAAAGQKRIDWAERQMDVLRLIHQRFARQRPLQGVRVACCLHVTTETAVLASTLKAGGAQVVVCASNPLSTQDDTAAALVTYHRIPVFARKGENRAVYYRHLNTALDTKPHLTMDDGADLVSLLHAKRPAQAVSVWGSTEETTTGVVRLRSMERHGVLRFPVIAVNDSKTKHFFDNRYGTGQSTIDGLLRATNVLLAGKTFVVAGYGFCGKGVATRARGMGAHVIVTEVDPVRALEANLDGFQVMSMAQAASHGDIFVTVTGNASVIRPEHVARMKRGAIIGNSGHFDVEIDMPAITRRARRSFVVRPFVRAYEFAGGRTIYLIAEGRLLNLVAAEGHPAAVMDMSFANQALAAEYVVKHHRTLEHRVYTLPEALDQTIARLKLRVLGLTIDTLTLAQRRYLAGWQQGT
ncbi:MAG: adenosylhomocysteinase [Candidatus Kerfeldbacteria bacterium]|nr:adenosylhomocysteinase [Candidatus Kerfeldbacteria bacterium]